MPTFLVPTLWMSALGISGLVVTTQAPGGSLFWTAAAVLAVAVLALSWTILGSPTGQPTMKAVKSRLPGPASAREYADMRRSYQHS